MHWAVFEPIGEMTRNDIDRGIVGSLVRIAAIKPAEFAVIRLRPMANGR